MKFLTIGSFRFCWGALILMTAPVLRLTGGELKQVSVHPSAYSAPEFIDAGGHLFTWGGPPVTIASSNRRDHDPVRDDLLMFRTPLPQIAPWPVFQSTGHGAWRRVSGDNVALSEDGELYEWGTEAIDDYNTERIPFRRIEKPDGVSAWHDFAAGLSVKAAIADNGELYVWGLAINELFDEMSFDGTDYGSGLRRVIRPAGVGHWIKVKVNDVLLPKGHGVDGACGSIADRPWRSIGVLGSDGKIYHWGSVFERVPTGECSILPPGEKYHRVVIESRVIEPPLGVRAWTDFSLGLDFSLAMGADGRLYSWGGNSNGELGVGRNGQYNEFDVEVEPVAVKFPPEVSRCVSFAAGSGTALAIGDNGRVYWWGRGGLGYADEGMSNLVSQADIAAQQLQDAELGLRPVALQLPEELGPWTHVQAGYRHALAVGSQGNIYECWNNQGLVPMPAFHTRTPTNYAPFVRMRSPVGDYSFPDPTNVTLKAEAVDVDGAIKNVQFLVDGQAVGDAHLYTNIFYHLDVPLISYGRHEIVARAVDDQGAVTESEPSVLHVQSRVWLDAITNHDLVEPSSPSDTTRPAILRFHRDGAVSQQLDVWFEILPESATDGQDYQMLGPVVDNPKDSALKRIVFPAGVSEVAMGIQSLFDGAIEESERVGIRWLQDELVDVTQSNPWGLIPGDYRFDPWINFTYFTISDSSTFISTNFQGEMIPQPFVFIENGYSQVVPEGYMATNITSALLLNVHWPSEQHATPLTVELSYGGTAVPGQDYVALPNKMTIRPDQTSVPLPLIILRDNEVEPLETLTITPVPHVCTDPADYDPEHCYLASGSATFTIYDQPVSTTMTPPDGDTNLLQLRFVRYLGPMGHWLELNGGSGSSVWLESSKDLQSWSPLQKFIDPVNAFQFLDWSQPQADRRFYRLRLDGGGQ